MYGGAWSWPLLYAWNCKCVRVGGGERGDKPWNKYHEVCVHSCMNVCVCSCSSVCFSAVKLQPVIVCYTWAGTSFVMWVSIWSALFGIEMIFVFDFWGPATQDFNRCGLLTGGAANQLFHYKRSFSPVLNLFFWRRTCLPLSVLVETPQTIAEMPLVKFHLLEEGKLIFWYLSHNSPWEIYENEHTNYKFHSRRMKDSCCILRVLLVNNGIES